MQLLCNPWCAIQVCPTYQQEINSGVNYFMQFLGNYYVKKLAANYFYAIILAAMVLDNIGHPWILIFYPVSGLGSGGIIPGRFRLQFCPGCHGQWTCFQIDSKGPNSVTVTDLFSCRFREGISFPNFLERSIPELPLSKLGADPFAIQNRALFEGEKMAKICRVKERKRGGQQRGQKGKKDAWKQVR